MGRHNFFFPIHLSALFGVDHMGPGWEYDWEQGGVAYHRADRWYMEQDHFRLDAPAEWHPEYITQEVCDEAWATMDKSFMPNDRLMMNGCDYAAGQRFMPDMVARLNEVDAKRRWVHVTMPEYIALMEEQIKKDDLPVVEGELRDGPAGIVTGNALTTRLYLKQHNKRAQNLLIRFAEPMDCLAEMAGAPGWPVLLERAWNYLLEAHPHDSVNGVTQDKTVRDVESRLDQVCEIAETLGDKALQELTQRIDCAGYAPSDALVIVFNPLPYARQEVVEAFINLPGHIDCKRSWGAYQPIQLYDAAGAPVGTQWEGASNQNYPVAEGHTRAFPYLCQRHHVYFDAGEIPACGYKVFRVGDASPERGRDGAWQDTFERSSSILTSPNTLDNGFVRVSMNPNGTFDLTDLVRGKTYPNQNYYEDRGEHGDYWINERPVYDQVHTSMGCNARVWAEEHGPLQATLVSEITMRIPSKGIRAEDRRGDGIAEIPIRTAVTVRADDPVVEVNVRFDNTAEDHMLRACFPTNLEAATHAHVGGHFTVDQRAIRPQGPTDDLVWPDMGTLPHNMFADVSDGTRGIAFLNDSLMEYEIMDNAERTVALSLLRATRDWICTEMRTFSVFPSQKGGQCLGPQQARYALYPHGGDWREGNVAGLAERFNVPVRPVQTRQHKGDLPAGEAALFAIEARDLRFSALKRAEDRGGYILRVHNPTDDDLTGSIRSHFAISQAWRCTLNEERIEELPVPDGHALAFPAKPQEIVTIELA
jgi:mannosylglycerate hydrolase